MFQKFLSKLGPFQWALHNMLAHPIMEVLKWINLTRWGEYLHKIIVPGNSWREQGAPKNKEKDRSI